MKSPLGGTPVPAPTTLQCGWSPGWGENLQRSPSNVGTPERAAQPEVLTVTSKLPSQALSPPWGSEESAPGVECCHPALHTAQEMICLQRIFTSKELKKMINHANTFAISV